MTDSVLLCVPGSVDGILVMLKKEPIATNWHNTSFPSGIKW